MKKLLFLKFTVFGLAALLPYLLLKTIFPSIPSLSHEIKICERHQVFGWNFVKYEAGVVTSCSQVISLENLYRARAVVIKMETNQPLKVNASLRYKNNELLSSESVNLVPKTDSVELVLDRKYVPKFNRLVHNSDQIVFFFNYINTNNQPNLRIDEVILK